MAKVPVLQIDQFHSDENSNRLYANDLKSHLKEHDFITKSHKHNFYLLVLFTHGSGWHQIDFETYSVKPSSIFVLKPGQVHNWNLSKDIQGYIFFHTKEFFDTIIDHHPTYENPFYARLDGSSHLELLNPQAKVVTAIFKDLLEEYKGTNALRYRKMCVLLDLFYIEMTRIIEPSSHLLEYANAYSSKMKKFEFLLEEAYKVSKAPSFYADKLNISARHLNRICQEGRGKSATELIQDRVILEARRLLVHGSPSVSEVSIELGFEDPSYFSRVFKNKTGESPSQFALKYQSAI